MPTTESGKFLMLKLQNCKLCTGEPQRLGGVPGVVLTFSELVLGLPVGESAKQKEECLRGHVHMERGSIRKGQQSF